ncbi:hypothetical protein ACFWBB_16140 [Streptomyces sp. NPDC060000]|uniref:hypothetical protein n=1 Tax=Streptomyces sp. NPDC060000 TaxID=3347031 RepID=UPI0036C7A6CF
MHVRELGSGEARSGQLRQISPSRQTSDGEVPAGAVPVEEDDEFEEFDEFEEVEEFEEDDEFDEDDVFEVEVEDPVPSPAAGADDC